MKKKNGITLLVLMLCLITLTYMACSSLRTATNTPAMKNAFEGDFLIGTALNADQIRGKSTVERKIILHQFNAITAENVMKSEELRKGWDDFEFEVADEFVDLGHLNNLYIVGHTLVWHSQLSPFARNIQNRDSMIEFIRSHIQTVAGRYSGKIDAWDVVNEALNEDGSLRNSVFLKSMGSEYIRLAFKEAAKADPHAKLYYNDYNNEQPKKRAGTIMLIKDLQENGIKVDGVGIQGHWHLGMVPFEEIEQSIIEYAALGLEVAITELDINVLPRPDDISGADINLRYKENPAYNPYTSGLPADKQQQLANDYERLFQILLKHRDKISRVTFWGVHDGQSWLNGWPISGRTNHALPFDRKYRPKEAFNRIMALKKQP